MTTGENRGRRALAALAELARGSARPPTPAQLDGGLDALRARINTERAARRSAVLRWSLAGTLAVAAAALVAVGVLKSEHWRAPGAPPAMAYRVEGGSLVDGGYLRESGRSGIKLFFSEGTEFILMPGTRSRLRAVDGAGARIAIEHGTAAFQVTPSVDHRWQVDVGPFLVTVKGTVFTVSWDAATEKFELKLRHGRVTVSGPVSGGEIALRAGQRLMVDLPQGQTMISEQPEAWTDVAAGPATEPAPAPATESSPAHARKPVPAPSTTRLDGDRGWATAVAAGEFDRILEQARRDGMKKTLNTASSGDLQALADAARYRVNLDLARDTLLAIRRRFPDSSHARDAAFILGRVEEASDGRLARALEWYDEYLTRSPKGAYAPEALGRKMTLTSKLKGAAEARSIATEYLQRFPSGPYAGPAQAFLRTP
jgi:ferric-dicitrate binding protein FerR (iron transport regulator)